jgi:copper chaperone
MTTKQTFDVQGMTCGHCEMAVKRAVRQLDPQAEIQIDRSRHWVEVQSEQPREAIAQAITEEGYAVAA